MRVVIHQNEVLRIGNYIVHDAKVRRMFYIASDLLKTLREFNNISEGSFSSISVPNDRQYSR